MPSNEDRVKRAFPDSEWEWWYVSNKNGTTSYFAIVFTESRTVLGQAMDHSLTVACKKAYRRASKHPHVASWHAKREAVHEAK